MKFKNRNILAAVTGEHVRLITRIGLDTAGYMTNKSETKQTITLFEPAMAHGY